MKKLGVMVGVLIVLGVIAGIFLMQGWEIQESISTEIASTLRKPTSVPSLVTTQDQVSQVVKGQVKVANKNYQEKKENSSLSALQAHSNSLGNPDGSDLQSYLRKNYPGNWALRRDDLDRVFSIMGGEIPEVGKNAESAAEFAKTVAQLLGVPAEQIAESDTKLDSSPKSVTYDFPQIAQGFDVFDGQMRMIARRQDGAVYMINTELRQVQAFQPKILYGVEDARQLIEEKYANREKVSITLKSKRPVIWADDVPAELAWFFIVKIGGSAPDRIQVLVSAQSARVLLERSLLVN